MPIHKPNTVKRTWLYFFSSVALLGLLLAGGCTTGVQHVQTARHIAIPEGISKNHKKILLVMGQKDADYVLKGKLCMLCDRVLINAGEDLRRTLLFSLWNVFYDCGFDYSIPENNTYDYVLKVRIKDARMEIGRSRWDTNRIYLGVRYELYGPDKNLVFSLQPETGGIGKPERSEATVGEPPPSANSRKGVDLFHKSLANAWHDSVAQSIESLMAELNTRQL